MDNKSEILREPFCLGQQKMDKKSMVYNGILQNNKNDEDIGYFYA